MALIDAFSADEVRHDLAWAPGRAVWHAREVSSTQDELRRWAERGAPDGAVVLADRQSAGRGRQGRVWDDFGGGNLLVSVLLRSSTRPRHLPSFSPLVAWSLREALGAPVGSGLKWPNDLMINDRKVAGVLLESMGGSGTSVLIGVGMNILEPESGWGELAGAATSLEAQGIGYAPETILADWLPRLDNIWQHFLQHGLESFLDDWNAVSVLRGRSVEWRDGIRTLRGVAGAVVTDGSLAVDLPDGRSTRLYAAEVHLEGGTA